MESDINRAVVDSSDHCNSFTKILICMGTFDDTSKANIFPRREGFGF